MRFDYDYFTAHEKPLAITGSCILWKGTSLVPRLIRLWSDYSHASLVIRLPSLPHRVLLIEALRDGLQPRLLSDRLRHYNGTAALFVPYQLTGSAQKTILELSLLECAKDVPYDWGGLFKNMIGRVHEDARKFFCSEWIDWVWRKAGLERRVDTGKAPRPGDLPKWFFGVLTPLRSIKK